MNRRELLRSYTTLHNAGVQTGDFEPILALFRDNARMIFRGICQGPFIGREAIAKAFKDNPPDDELIVIGIIEYDTAIQATYGWSKNPGVVDGMLHLVDEEGLIKKLTINVGDS